jgi:hypothetical protein
MELQTARENQLLALAVFSALQEEVPDRMT